MKRKKVIKNKTQKKAIIRKKRYSTNNNKKIKKDNINNKKVLSSLPPSTFSELSTLIPKKIRKKRSKGPSANKRYFDESTEQAIIDYNKETDQTKREYIYNNKIKSAFEKLCECVFNTFKFSYFEVGPLDIQKETISHLVSNIDKFTPEKGKAFSYFSIIAKHYLIALNNSTWKRRNQHVEISEEKDENTIQLQMEDKYHKNVQITEFVRLMITFWDLNIDKVFVKQKDLFIAQAVIELFRRSEKLDIFNKKALYLMIREISGCRTQAVTKIINKLKPIQLKLYKSYINNGTVPTKLSDI